jgi:hypothetical protein
MRCRKDTGRDKVECACDLIDLPIPSDHLSRHGNSP